MKHNTTLGLAALVALTLGATPAHAYLDPGTGSYILHVLVATVAGMVYYLRSFFSPSPAAAREDPEEDAEDEEVGAEEAPVPEGAPPVR